MISLDWVKSPGHVFEPFCKCRGCFVLLLKLRTGVKLLQTMNISDTSETKRRKRMRLMYRIVKWARLRPDPSCCQTSRTRWSQGFHVTKTARYENGPRPNEPIVSQSLITFGVVGVRSSQSFHSRLPNCTEWAQLFASLSIKCLVVWYNLHVRGAS